MHDRAGQKALPNDLIDIDKLTRAYYTESPDMSVAAQRVAFGTSGHRGSSFTKSFNETHILAVTQAIVEYRAGQGITGPLFIGRDTHALSMPAHQTALEVLAGNGVHVLEDARASWVPTPALSRAIVAYNTDPAHSEVQADGIIITPSHNPPQDGGFKYNPPHGGPADSDVTKWIENRANELIERGNVDVHTTQVEGKIDSYDFLTHYVKDLAEVIDFEAIQRAGVRIGADPLGGSSVEYWQAIADTYGIDLTVINPKVDPRWPFMTLDWDGKIRMDPSSPSAMASVLAHREDYDIVTGNDADADRHGIITPNHGLMNPNHYLAVAIKYLCKHRPQWPADARIGKTLVSSSMIDRVVAHLGRELVEVPVGFKWFVPGLSDGSVLFGGEESAGASFLTFSGDTWTTDKDGILLALLAAEILAVTGRSPAYHYAELVKRFGNPRYERLDAPATPEQKAKLSKLTGDMVLATQLAGEPITAKLTSAPGNGAAIGGLKVVSENAWFAARPSGTENVYKIYAESFLGAEHLAQVQTEAKQIVDEAMH